jgi:guanine deaminase
MTKLIRGQILSFGKTHYDVTHESKGGVVVGDDGTILWSGPLSLLPRNFQGIPTDDYDDCIVMPGFIDAHIHFPQLRMLAPRQGFAGLADAFYFSGRGALL